MKYFVVLLLGLFTTIASGQLSDLSDEQIRKAITVHQFSETDFKLNDEFENKTKELLKNRKLSLERYGEILRAEINGHDITLSDSEKVTLEELRDLKTEYDSEKENRLSNTCIENGISLAIYKEVIRSFTSKLDIEDKDRLELLYNEVKSKKI